MEQYVKALFDRLDGKDDKLAQQLLFIMQKAIGEMHNQRIIAGLSGVMEKAAHDEDPEVRITVKTQIAKSVGREFIPEATPSATAEGLSYSAKLNYHPEFVNSITLCFQGGLEGLMTMRALMKPSNPMRYRISVNANGHDLSPLRENIDFLNHAYAEDFVVEIVPDGAAAKPGETSAHKEETAETAGKPNVVPVKKKGILAKLFGKK